MAEKNADVKKALAIMAKNKKARDAAGQQSANDAGVPAYMMASANQEYVGPDASNSDGQAPRAMMEQQNNQLAQKLFKAQQDKIKKGK